MPDPSIPSSLNRRPAVSTIRRRVASLCSLPYRATAAPLVCRPVARGTILVYGLLNIILRLTGKCARRADPARDQQVRHLVRRGVELGVGELILAEDDRSALRVTLGRVRQEPVHETTRTGHGISKDRQVRPSSR